jgi:formylglycine-generating enzyme
VSSTRKLRRSSSTWRAVLAALAACLGCNAIFDIQDPLHKAAPDDGALACTLTSDCPADEGLVCIFARCSPPCAADVDCTGTDERCLQTDEGTACVSNAQPACAAGASASASVRCPSGSVCVDDVCYGVCSEASPCTDGHLCEAGACKGPAMDVEAGGGGGVGGNDGAAGQGGASGEGGGGEGGTQSSTTCGNGTLDGAERCDDGNPTAGDGCNSTCRIEPGWNCSQSEPTVCSPICGDGLVQGTEATAGACDDGNTDSADGCSSKCKVEASYVCSGAPSVCAKTCGNGQLDAGEGCDDGNTASNDGCLACAVETGFLCNNSGSPSVCTDVDECTVNTDNCDTHAKCTNTKGSFTCACNTGYSGSGLICTPRSCVGLAATCGPSGNKSCCASSVVTGGAFKRDNDVTYPATVSNFQLDNYEITVGRFRKFVAAYSQAMTPSGAGKNPKNPSDMGWATAWNTSLAADATALKAALKCTAAYQTWTDAAGTAAAESLPINCVDWFEAEAFCIWDGGRLPTEAEWNYAAVGGTAQLTFPFGDAAPNGPDCTYANFIGAADGTEYCVAPGTGGANRVGSESPKGDGLYGQADLAGNIWEWVQDWYVTPYNNPQCSNCANSMVASDRGQRGGSYLDDASLLLSSYRNHSAPSFHHFVFGARCARTP